MFRIAEDPSSGSLVQCWAKNYRNDSIVSVGMDRPRGFQEVEAPRFPRQLAHNDGKVITPKDRPPVNCRKYSW